MDNETLASINTDRHFQFSPRWHARCQDQSCATPSAMIESLGSDDEEQALLAAVALIERGEAAVPELIQALGNSNILQRRRVIWPLQMIGDQRAVSALIAMLNYDADAKARRYAAWVLGEMGGKRAIKPLIDAFGDPDDRVRWDAAVALEKIGSEAIMPLIYALHYGAPLVRVGAVNALAWIHNSSATHVLIGALKDVDDQVRTRAAFALGWMGDRRAVKYLIDALQDPVDEVRMQAAVALGWIGDPRAIEPLVDMMGEAHEWVPTAAVEALMIACSFGNPQVRVRAQRILFQRQIVAGDSSAVHMPDMPSRLSRWANKTPAKRKPNFVIVN